MLFCGDTGLLEKLVAGDSRKKETKKGKKKARSDALSLHTNVFLFVSVKPEAELPTQEEMPTQ